jgi:DNA adenine methylase
VTADPNDTTRNMIVKTVRSRALTPSLKWHGGKHYLAAKIVELMPLHTHYVEPFAGGLRVLLAKNPEGVSEVVNDLNGDLTNFWRVLQNPADFDRLRRTLEATPFSEAEWDGAEGRLADPDPVVGACAFFTRCRQSLAGRMDCFAPLSRTRTRRGMNEQAAAWLSAVEGLPAVHERLKRVAILNRDALDVIRQQDGPDTLFYLDPPYLPGTRTAPTIYAHEMSEDAHRELLRAIRKCEAGVILSGYPNDLYDAELAHWSRKTFPLPNHAAGGKAKRQMTEVVWFNW